ncbi:MAG: hypothetical protein WCA97_04865 [Terriglobales bacterium]
MASKRRILFPFTALLTAAISLLAGCGGSTANVQNPPPPPPPNVSIAFQSEPAGSVAVGFTENLTAVVTNDPDNYGVDWSLVCPGSLGAGNCGALSVLHTASGAANTYTAPVSLSGNSIAVEIVAYATAYPSKNVTAPITVTSFDSNFPAGTYVLQVQGADSNLNPYQCAAALVLDGNGNVKNGEQVANYESSGSLLDANLSGSYFLGNDGRGTITLNTNDNNIGNNGVETFAFVYLSSSHALISQMDLGNAATGVSASGTLDLQTTTAAPAGGYAFVVSGTDVVVSKPLAFGGVFNIDSANGISGNGSVTDEILAKKVNATGLAISGTLTSPDEFGAVTLKLMAPFGAANKAIPLQFTGYIVDDSHLELIETDTAAGNAAPFGLTAGVAIGQGAATGTFTGPASFSGTYVFGVTGVDLSNLNLAPSTLTSVGLFTADASGNLDSGYTDTFLDVNTIQGSNANPQVGAQISVPFTGTYSVDSTGTGRARSTAVTFDPEPKHGYQPAWFFYLTGSGKPLLVLEAGDSHYPSLGSGIAYPQSTAAPSFSGDYGFSFTQELSGAGENDGTGQLNAISSTTPPLLSGFTDINLNFGANLDQPFTGSFSAPTAAGAFPGFLVGTNNNTVSSAAFTPQIAVDYYFIDPGHGFFVETDLVNSVPPTTPPAPSGQVSLGYYAARTPVCSDCP